MSRSSSDVFEDIRWQANYASEESRAGQCSKALVRLIDIEELIKEAKRRLDYEIQCQIEVLYGPRR